MSTLTPSTVQSTSASTSMQQQQSLHISYIFYVFLRYVTAPSTDLTDLLLRLSSTSHFCEHFRIPTPLHSCLYKSRRLHMSHLASSLQSQKRSTYYTCFYIYACLCGLHSTSIAAHHLPCSQGGKECMATLHSSDRDSTLLYMLHLHFANIFRMSHWFLRLRLPLWTSLYRPITCLVFKVAKSAIYYHLLYRLLFKFFPPAINVQQLSGAPWFMLASTKVFIMVKYFQFLQI